MHRLGGFAGILVACLLKSAVAQTPSLIPPPGPDVPTTDCHADTAGHGLAGKLCLYKCANKGQILTCSLIYTREIDKPFAYNANASKSKSITLIDDFKSSHPLLREYYLDGRGKHQQNVILDKGDYIWLIEEFGEGASDIKTARIVFSKPNGKLWFSLSGPVESIQ